MLKTIYNNSELRDVWTVDSDVNGSKFIYKSREYMPLANSVF